jgi:RNA polymerase sigma-70 factor (ECF subfamily)
VRTQSARSANEGTIIAAARGGDPKAFTELVRRYEETVFRFAFKLCRDREKAEETFQDTFVNVYRKLDTFDGKSKFSTWLYSIVTNNCLMKHRQASRRAIEESLEEIDDPSTMPGGRFPAAVPQWGETPVDVVLDKELRAQLEHAIQKLPPEYRVVFTLRDIEGKSTQETSDIVGITEEAAKSRLRRARAFLRRELDPYLAIDRRPRRDKGMHR